MSRGSNHVLARTSIPVTAVSYTPVTYTGGTLTAGVAIINGIKKLVPGKKF